MSHPQRESLAEHRMTRLGSVLAVTRATPKVA
jgi:hypothetical protein